MQFENWMIRAHKQIAKMEAPSQKNVDALVKKLLSHFRKEARLKELPKDTIFHSIAYIFKYFGIKEGNEQNIFQSIRTNYYRKKKDAYKV